MTIIFLTYFFLNSHIVIATATAMQFDREKNVFRFHWHLSVRFIWRKKVDHLNRLCLFLEWRFMENYIAATLMMSSHGADALFFLFFVATRDVKMCNLFGTRLTNVARSQCSKVGGEPELLMLSALQLSIHLSTRQILLINVQIEFMHLILWPPRAC